MNIARIDLTTKEAVERWNSGDPVFTIEMGGIGPDYENCIQDLVFEFLNSWPADVVPKLDGTK